MSADVVSRGVNVSSCLAHETVEHTEQVLGDALSLVRMVRAQAEEPRRAVGECGQLSREVKPGVEERSVPKLEVVVLVDVRGLGEMNLPVAAGAG